MSFVVLSSPEVQKYLHKVEDERKKAALNKDQDNRSFIQKYVSLPVTTCLRLFVKHLNGFVKLNKYLSIQIIGLFLWSKKLINSKQISLFCVIVIITVYSCCSGFTSS